MTILVYTVNTLFIVVAIILMLLILIQKGRGGGLASAFGGVGGHTAFGSKTGDVLTWATAIVFGVFLLLAVLANLTFNKVGGGNKPAAITTPTLPGAPGSSVPQAPLTADPGVGNPPPAAPTGDTGTSTEKSVTPSNAQPGTSAPVQPQPSAPSVPGPTTRP